MFVPVSVHVLPATHVAGVLLGNPMALVDGAVGSEGRTALRKATGFWILPVGERGAGVTVCAWNCFTPLVESVNEGSLGLGRGWSLLLVNAPDGLDGAGGGFPRKCSMLFVLGAAWGLLLKVPEELAEGLAAGGGVCGLRNCLERP